TADQRSEDDIVTLLWQAELVFFQYSYVDALAEGLQLPQGAILPIRQLDMVPAAEAGGAGPAPGEVPPPAVTAGQPPVAAAVSRDDFEETLYFLEAAELELLAREVSLEEARDIKADVLAALFDRFEDEDQEWREEILRILRQVLPVYLG